MTPAARLSAAIEVMADIESRRRPASDALKDWGLAHRFAGSGDRAAIAGIAYDALRRKASAAFLMGEDTPRALLLGMLRLERGLDLGAVAPRAPRAPLAPAPARPAGHSPAGRSRQDRGLARSAQGHPHPLVACWAADYVAPRRQEYRGPFRAGFPRRSDRGAGRGLATRRPAVGRKARRPGGRS